MGGVCSIQVYFGFLNFFNFAKPLSNLPEITNTVKEGKMKH